MCKAENCCIGRTGPACTTRPTKRHELEHGMAWVNDCNSDLVLSAHDQPHARESVIVFGSIGQTQSSVMKHAAMAIGATLPLGLNLGNCGRACRPPLLKTLLSNLASNWNVTCCDGKQTHVSSANTFDNKILSLTPAKEVRS